MGQDNKGAQNTPFGKAAGGEPMEWLDGDKSFLPEGTKVVAPKPAPKRQDGSLPDWAITPEGMD
jgi:hypothetical protein